MNDTAKTISEFLLERLRENAALEAAGEAGPPVEAMVDPRPEVRQKAEHPPDRGAALRAYAQTAEEEGPRLLGSG